MPTTLIITVVIAMALVSWIPGVVASNRRHRNTAAIAVCGFMGILFAPFWVAALVWAITNDVETGPRTGKNARRSQRRKSRVSRRVAHHQAQEWTAEDAGSALDEMAKRH